MSDGNAVANYATSSTSVILKPDGDIVKAAGGAIVPQQCLDVSSSGRLAGCRKKDWDGGEKKKKLC